MTGRAGGECDPASIRAGSGRPPVGLRTGVTLGPGPITPGPDPGCDPVQAGSSPPLTVPSGDNHKGCRVWVDTTGSSSTFGCNEAEPPPAAERRPPDRPTTTRVADRPSTGAHNPAAGVATYRPSTTVVDEQQKPAPIEGTSRRYRFSREAPVQHFREPTLRDTAGVRCWTVKCLGTPWRWRPPGRPVACWLVCWMSTAPPSPWPPLPVRLPAPARLLSRGRVSRPAVMPGIGGQQTGPTNVGLTPAPDRSHLPAIHRRLVGRCQSTVRRPPAATLLYRCADPRSAARWSAAVVRGRPTACCRPSGDRLAAPACREPRLLLGWWCLSGHSGGRCGRVRVSASQCRVPVPPFPGFRLAGRSGSHVGFHPPAPACEPPPA